MYWKGSCSHTAVRLLSPRNPVLFWDPGGSYGKPDRRLPSFQVPADVERHFDLILEDAPDLETYFDSRRALGNLAVEVFEWRISDEQGQRLHDTLVAGAAQDRSKGAFKTQTAPMYCSDAASRFLRGSANDILEIPKDFFFPHRLSRVLYTQSPERVVIYRIPADSLEVITP